MCRAEAEPGRCAWNRAPRGRTACLPLAADAAPRRGSADVGGGDHTKSVQEILAAVAALGPEERRRYLDEHCPDPEVRARVLLLLERDAAAAAGTGSTVAFELPEPGADETELPPFAGLDEFRVLRRIGRGGMATVYLAEDTTLERLVALKVLPARHTASETRVARFRREAIAVAGLHHPGIVAVYRVGQAHGLHYIAMEFVDGTTLAGDILQRRDEARERGTRTRLADARRTAAMIASVADALDHAHRHGLIHRDVKPSNILIGPGEQAKLADFGIAKSLADETITDTGIVPGTYHYMSPEQAASLPGKVDPRSDVFSLGSVLYQALTLELPFDGETTQDIVHQIISKEPRGVRTLSPAVPRDLETICQKAMEKDVEHRYQTAGQFAADLRAFLAGRDPMARRRSVIRRLRAAARGHRTAAAAGAIVALGAVVVALAASDARRRSAAACRLTVTSRPGGAAVHLGRFADDADEIGAFQLLGTTPLAGAALSPGRYRVVVIGDDARFAETDVRFFSPGEAQSLEVALFWTDELSDGMVPVDGGAYEMGGPQGGPFQEPRTPVLAPFFIDECEVTNAEYLAFMKEGGAEPPICWSADPDPEFLAKPVVTLPPERMEAYARWRGKRLPTAAEWEAACRRRDGRRFPWGEGRPARWPQVDDIDRRTAQTPDPVRQRAHYDRYVVAARSQPELCSREGVFHFAGNVEEMTSSWHLTTGRVVVTKGGSWLDDWERLDFTWSDTRPGQTSSFLLGFRCARSASSRHVHNQSN